MMATLLKSCRKTFFIVAFFSAVINVLMLAVPIYTLQLYDRVLASQSSDTLIYLCFIVVSCLVLYALLEWLRGRVLLEVSHWLDNQLSPNLLSRSVDRVLLGNRYGFEVPRDMATIKNFLKSPSAFTLLDMPWFPLFLIVIFFISGVLGWIALIGAVILFSLAYLNQKISLSDLAKASQLSGANTHSVENILNQAEVIQAMGMMPAFIKQWFSKNNAVLHFQSESANHMGWVSSSSKFVRLFIQVMLLTVGAYLAMRGELTGGAMIAASIISGRALAPVEQCISAWKEFYSAHAAWERINTFATLPELRPKAISLPKAMGKIECEHLIYMPAHAKQPLLQDIHFALSPGESVAILGPSGAGKSTLGRMLLGLWPATRGAVRLDGADVYTWDREAFGKQVGYLPQDNGLMPGTIKENIACLNEGDVDEAVILAATMANAHEMILRLPKGYDTLINEYQLSGGQAKRVALARAFYKSPCFMVLDEPETHLDVEGEAALIDVITKIKATQKITLVIITRHIKLIQLMSNTLVLRDGKMQAYGKTEDILEKMKSKQ